ncbi:MAG: SRPBCC family protein [Ilumatobacteraceae bacterium]
MRYERRIQRSAKDVWQLVGAPERLHEWFPGIISSVVEGTTRSIVTGAGIPMPEEILVNDANQMRFQYRVTSPLLHFHRGSIDVIELAEQECLVVYTTDADPRTMALVIGGAAAEALDELQRQMELSSIDRGNH